ncbi:hypothetical protein KSP39_PZI018924 [Platanthera zijinensis]|uniref:Uncharacterized protein n=1 Tax=Platanthera zijinensis TaxID=2320716 RepID=A0AAP0B490_9ASPA
MPLSIVNKISTLLSSFFWSGTEQKHSIHYAKWSEICLPKDKGGLGFKNLLLWRRVLMGNVAARILRADGSFLARVLECKYIGRNRFSNCRSNSKIWKCKCLGREIVEKHSFWMVCNGTTISTLEDNWIGILPLSKWPTFLNISAMPAHVAGLLDPDFLNISAMPAHVAGLLHPDFGWSAQLVSGFSSSLVDQILKHLFGNCKFAEKIKAVLARFRLRLGGFIFIGRAVTTA